MNIQPLTVIFPTLPTATNAPKTVHGYALIVPPAADFIGKGVLFIGQEATVGNVVAHGVIDAHNNFTDGSVSVTYTGEGLNAFAVASGVATQAPTLRAPHVDPATGTVADLVQALVISGHMDPA